MFKKIFKKEEVQYTPEISQNEDWTKDIRRSKKIGHEVEQLTFFNDNKGINETNGTKKGLSKDHLTILINCKEESTAVELMKILNRTNRTKFKQAIIEPLIDHSFLERTIPDSPKSPSQKYRLTGKFIKRRSRT
jgi:CDP-diacylglycerol pyrophosphatase